MMLAALQIPVPPVPPSGGHMNAAAAIVALAVLGTALAIIWPLVRALARRLEGGAVAKELREEVEGLRSRLDQLEEGQGRIADVEERLEFAERMLAQTREPDRLQR
jgi:hypothetical protein